MDNIHPLIWQAELPLQQSLRHVIAISNPDIGLIAKVTRERQYNDEPKFWSFSAYTHQVTNGHNGLPFQANGSGFSFFSQDEALHKCLVETVERYTNHLFDTKSVVYTGSFSSLPISRYIPISQYARFTNKQLKDKRFAPFHFTKDTPAQWTTVRSLFSDDEKLVPCSLVYLSYKPISGEKDLYPPISNGVAGGSSLSAALLRAVYELIERDAYIIHYHNRLPGKLISIKKNNNKRIRFLCEVSERYNLQLIVRDIRTDIDVPVILAIVIDRTGIGKAVSVGLKSSLNINSAIEGAISEAFHTRGWIRTAFSETDKKITTKELLHSSSIKNRALLWYQTDSIDKIKFWINGTEPSPMAVKIKNTGTNPLEKVLQALKKCGFDVFWKDLSRPELESSRLKIVKVIIPELQPMYLNERYPIIGGSRIHDVPARLGYPPIKEVDLNKFPHPFL